MKSITLNWHGWWMLRTPLKPPPDLDARRGILAIMGARLKWAGSGVGSMDREIVAFSRFGGDATFAEQMVTLQKLSLGVFIDERCREIGKYPLVYAAPLELDDDALDTVVAALYAAFPFAPHHSALPPHYSGGPLCLLNKGKHLGFPPEIIIGEAKKKKTAADTVNPDAQPGFGADTVNPDLENAIAGGNTRRAGNTESDLPRLVEPEVLLPEKPDDGRTEFVPKPGQAAPRR